MVLWTLYSKNPVDINNNLFLKQQISILEWFLKDHVTLKTGVMILKMIILCGAADTEQRTQFASSRYSPKWRNADAEEMNCWIVIIFVFFAYKKYSRSFIMLRLNHWWQMEYLGDVFHTFLDLDSVIYLAVNGTVTSLPVFTQNILNCVPKTKWAFTGLERHGGKWLMTNFSFWGGVTL